MRPNNVLDRLDRKAVVVRISSSSPYAADSRNNQTPVTIKNSVG